MRKDLPVHRGVGPIGGHDDLVHAPAVVGTPFADGSWGLLHRDREETAAALDETRAAWEAR